MRLFLQVDINDWQKRAYDQPLTRLASSLASDVVAADLDNRSEPPVVNLVLKLVDQSSSIFVLINSEPDQPIGPSVAMFNRLLTEPDKVFQVVLMGTNAMVEKLIVPLQSKVVRVSDREAAKATLLNFAHHH